MKNDMHSVMLNVKKKRLQIVILRWLDMRTEPSDEDWELYKKEFNAYIRLNNPDKYAVKQKRR